MDEGFIRDVAEVVCDMFTEHGGVIIPQMQMTELLRKRGYHNDEITEEVKKKHYDALPIIRKRFDIKGERNGQGWRYEISPTKKKEMWNFVYGEER